MAESEGLVLAHALKLDIASFQKGHVLTADDLRVIDASGTKEVIGARLEPGDLGEDIAVARLAAALMDKSLSMSRAATGRVNVYATCNGIFTANSEIIDQLNRIDPAITLACLADHSRVVAGAMVATFKIIPLAVAAAKLDEAVRLLQAKQPLEMKAFRPLATGLIATQLPSLKKSVMAKTARLLDQRLGVYGSHLAREVRVPHQAIAVSEALNAMVADVDLRPEVVVIFGASAVIDREDVIPHAIEACGGHVISVGMPVDPGNLLVLGKVGSTHIIGAPGCARSPKENGFDWILDRIYAGENPTRFDITGLGVGGLLMEIESRPRPRDPRDGI